MPSSIDIEHRRKAILERLAQQGTVSVEQLSQDFGVSAVTIRKDLVVLEEQGIAKRTYGGAELVHGKNSGAAAYEPSFNIRKKQFSAEKSAIAKQAAQLIQSGDSIAMDSSTTTSALIPFIKKIGNLTIYTNSLYVAQSMIDQPRINVLMPGGRFRRDSLALIGGLTQPEVNLSWGFFGARGLDLQAGITDVHQEEATFKRNLLAKCRKPIVLVDSSKWGLIASYTFATPQQIYRIITSTQTPQEVIQPFLDEKIDIHRAAMPLE